MHVQDVLCQCNLHVYFFKFCMFVKPRALLIFFKIGVIHIDINNLVCTISLVCLARTVAQVSSHCMACLNFTFDVDAPRKGWSL